MTLQEFANKYNLTLIVGGNTPFRVFGVNENYSGFINQNDFSKIELDSNEGKTIKPKYSHSKMKPFCENF